MSTNKKETVKKEVFTAEELEIFKEADSFGFNFVTVGDKVLFANSEQEQKNDEAKFKYPKLYKKTESGWIKA